MSSLPPVCSGPGVEAADVLVSHNSQVGVVVFPVPPDVSQRAGWHGHDRPRAPLHRAREHSGVSGLLLLFGCLLRSAVLRQEAVCVETQENMMISATPFYYHDHSVVYESGRGPSEGYSCGEEVNLYIDKGARRERSAVIVQKCLLCLDMRLRNMNQEKVSECRRALLSAPCTDWVGAQLGTAVVWLYNPLCLDKSDVLLQRPCLCYI